MKAAKSLRQKFTTDYLYCIVLSISHGKQIRNQASRERKYNVFLQINITSSRFST